MNTWKIRKVQDNYWHLYQEVEIGQWVLRHTAPYPTDLFKYLSDHIPFNSDINIETHSYRRHEQVNTWAE